MMVHTPSSALTLSEAPRSINELSIHCALPRKWMKGDNPSQVLDVAVLRFDARSLHGYVLWEQRRLGANRRLACRKMTRHDSIANKVYS